MHPNYRISLFLVLLLLPFTLIFAQDEPTPTGILAYSVYTADVDVALHLFSLADQTSTRISPEGAGREDAFPVFSPNGGRIAFLADGFLSFIGVDGEGLITTDIENPLYVSWSSDNSQVVYITETDDVYALHVYAVDGEDNRTYETDLTVSIESVPSWTTDGEAILFAGREDTETNNDIYQLSADFETLTNLTNSPSLFESSPSMSPDGQLISYKVSGSGGRLGDVWLMSSDGTDQRNLTEGRLALGSLYTPHIWSPDSTRFLVEDAGNGVAIITIRGTVIDFDAIHAVWSPDGQQIAYTTIMMNNRSGVALYDVWIIPADTPNDRQRIIQGAFGKIAWQPDPSITFEPVTLATPTPSATATPSVPQAQIESVLVQGQQSSWYFDGDADMSVTIIAQSGVFDTIAQLFTLNGDLLAENDDFDGTNSQIDFTLPQDGVYQVVVSSFYGDASGDYTLTVVGIEGDLREKPQGGRFIETPTPTPTGTSTPTATPTLRPTLTHTPTATFTPTVTPSPTFGFDRSQCPANLLPRLEVNARGRVLPGGSSTVYDQPVADSSSLGEIPGGVSFTVLDGPVCTDNRIWWQVEYRNVTGWVIEAGNGEYFLEPLRR